MQTAQGSLVIVGVNTTTPKVFWKGTEVLGVVSVKVENEVGDEQRVKLKVFDTNQDDILSEMASENVIIKHMGV